MAANADRYLHNGTETIGTDGGKDILGYKVNDNGIVTMTVASDDGKNTEHVIISNVASKEALDELDDGVVKYDKIPNSDNYNKNSITLAGDTYTTEKKRRYSNNQCCICR